MHREGRRVHVIINQRSGTPGKETAADRVSEYFSSNGVAARVELIRTPDDLPAAAERAAAGDADIIVAGGGDGTIATIAGAVLDTSKVLGVLPLGTFNYFAQRIGVPEDLDAALAVIAASTTTKTMSVGEVNGRVFLNNSSIGLYPAVLKQRESTYRRVGRSQAAAYLSVAFVLIQPPGFLNLQLTADGAPIARRTPLLFVGVNPQQMAAFGIPGYECLEDGRLALYITRPLSAPQLWRLALRGFLRGLHGAQELEVLCARELNVSLRRKRVRVAMDGEVVRLNNPLRYRLRENALRVLTAAPAERERTVA
jgi:diacylglycerol kinase family enzyme